MKDKLTKYLQIFVQTQRVVLPIAARCVGQRSTLRLKTTRASFAKDLKVLKVPKVFRFFRKVAR
jgi:hypothetical protein